MNDSWRDLIIDAIRERLIVTRELEFDVANEEAEDLCEAIFDTLDIDSDLQDVQWTVLARAITGRDFSVINSK